MHLAVLMTNTDESDFAQRHPKDGEKFEQLIHRVRPNWQLTSFAVKDAVFPTDITAFDGYIISGSPASVRDKDPWVEQLLELIRIINSKGIPMFGACFGHQAIALALGGEIHTNPKGWVFGATCSTVVAKADWMQELPDKLVQYAAHIEAVSRLPNGAEVLSESDTCTVTGFRIGNTVYTTQNHPEMTGNFVTALITEYENELPEDVVKEAKSSMTLKVDPLIYASTIARFFENASPDRSN